MNLIEKAEDALKGQDIRLPNARLYCSSATWEALHAEKDQLIRDKELSFVNAGTWTSFWGVPVVVDNETAFGVFVFKLLDPDPHYEHRKDELRRPCSVCGKTVGGFQGTPGNYVHCRRVFAVGEQILLGYLEHEWDICFDCWEKL